MARQQRTFTESDNRHGTQAGWAAHQTRGERPCDPCYLAKQEYDARHKAGTTKQRQNRLNARAQASAHKQLRKRYPDEYRALYQEEKARLLAEQERWLAN